MTFDCRHSKVTVVGLGGTGLSFVRFLKKRGAKVHVVDTSASPLALKQMREEYPDVTFQPVDLTCDELPRSDFVGLSPGVPRASFMLDGAIRRGIPVYSDIELFARTVSPSKTVLAITGSNGKTTTTALAGKLSQIVAADTQVAGNIGKPILDAFDENPDSSTWILELSSFQLESIYSLQLNAAAVINVTANHLDRYANFFAYAAAKERIFNHATRQVLNRDDLWSMAMQRVDRVVSTFGKEAPTAKENSGIVGTGSAATLMLGTELICRVDELGLQGAFNVQNALAALSITQTLGISGSDCKRVLQSFSGLPHRCELLGVMNGVRIINDSKATTTVATVAALDGLAIPTRLIAGGDSKGQQFASLADAAARHCQAVYLIGRDAALIATALQQQGVAYRLFPSLQEATVAALTEATAGEQILLSPACASWDAFRNYVHRAEVFTETVEAWAQLRGYEIELGVNHV